MARGLAKAPFYKFLATFLTGTMPENCISGTRLCKIPTLSFEHILLVINLGRQGLSYNLGRNKCGFKLEIIPKAFI